MSHHWKEAFLNFKFFFLINKFSNPIRKENFGGGKSYKRMTGPDFYNNDNN